MLWHSHGINSLNPTAPFQHVLVSFAHPHVSATFHSLFQLSFVLLPALLRPQFCVTHNAGLLRIPVFLKQMEQETCGSSHPPCSQISLGARLTGRKNAGTMSFPHSLTVTCLASSPCHSHYTMMMYSLQLLIGSISLKGTHGPCQNFPCHLLPALIKRLLLPSNPRSMRPFKKAVLRSAPIHEQVQLLPSEQAKERCRFSITEPCVDLRRA